MIQNSQPPANQAPPPPVNQQPVVNQQNAGDLFVWFSFLFCVDLFQEVAMVHPEVPRGSWYSGLLMDSHTFIYTVHL